MNIRDIMAKATAATEFMYDRTAVVKRYVDVIEESGANGMAWMEIYAGVPCRLSNAQLNNTDQGEANVIQYDTKLFLSSAFKMLAGDSVVVTTEDRGLITEVVEFESSAEPFVYVSHQEVLLKRKANA